MSSVGSSPGSAGAQHQAPNSFQRLVENLQDILGPTSGINSEDVDTEQLQQVMRDYKSRESDWGHFALADSSTNYTRNLVDKGNGKSNLLILVWNPAKGSPIHDHANAHCIMKVLKGSLKETRYGWPDRGNLEPPKLVQEQVFGADEVTYMSDTLGLHTISNPDARNIAVSLHRKLMKFSFGQKRAEIGSIHPSQCRQLRIQHLRSRDRQTYFHQTRSILLRIWQANKRPRSPMSAMCAEATRTE